MKHMEKLSSKREYLQPTVKVVEFRVEVGQVVSPLAQVLDDKAHTQDIVEGNAFGGEGYFDYDF